MRYFGRNLIQTYSIRITNYGDDKLFAISEYPISSAWRKNSEFKNKRCCLNSVLFYR